MIINPLDTTIGNIMNVDIKAIKIAIVNDELYEFQGVNGKILALVSSPEVKPLRIPIIVDDTIVFDVRQTINPTTGKVINRLGFERMSLSAMMIDTSLESINTFKEFYVKSMQVIISQAVRKALFIGLDDNKHLNNVICLYALSQFVDYSLEERLAISNNFLIGEALDADNLQQVIENTAGDIETLDDAMTVIHSMDNISGRLQKLNRDTLITAMQSFVFGDSVPLLIAGIEAPSLWLGLVYNMVTERSYSKTGLVITLEKYKKMIKLEDNVKKIKRLAKNYTFDYTQIQL